MAKVLLRRAELPALEHVVVMDDVNGLDDGFITSLDDLRASGTSSSESAAESLDALVKEVKPSDLATLVYTSGTTGPPKGTMITHANVMATMRSLTSLIDLRPDDRFLSFLPLSHITERSISNFGQIVGGSETWFARSIATLAEDLRACRPDDPVRRAPGLGEVPRRHPRAGRCESRSSSTCWPIATSQAPLALLDRMSSSSPSSTESSGTRFVGSLASITLGSSCCGAAPVHPDLLRWFHGIGIPIAEGYGQTEVSLCTSTNTPDDTRIGTVGRPIPGVSVRIADDDEILVKGANVCAGYWHDAAATRELIDPEGWMHSGDLGRLDSDGYLHVTGRKKDLIITAYGKNIAPEEIETRLRMEPLIAQAVVVGDNRPYLTALLTVDADAAAEWAAHRGRSLDIEALIDDHDLHAELSRAIERVNETHAHAEGIRRWRVLPRDLTVSGGELTADAEGQAPRCDGALGRRDRRDVRHTVGALTRSVRTSVRQFVQFDAYERLGPVRVIAHDVILDLVVVGEPKFAIRALVYRILHDSIVAPPGRPPPGTSDPT